VRERVKIEANNSRNKKERNEANYAYPYIRKIKVKRTLLIQELKKIEAKQILLIPEIRKIEA
jgi:hypothetical protein